MRLVSFNIHHGTIGRRGRVDPAALGEACASFEADVLALQEVDEATWRTRGVDLTAAVAGATGMAAVFGPSRRLFGGRYGNAVLVRGRILASEVVALPRVPGWRAWQERRTLLQVQAQVDGVDLHVAATHLAVPPRVSGPQLEVALDATAAAPQPAVLIGDLNREPGAVVEHLAGTGLALVEHGPTFPAHRPDQTIDHVVHTAGWEAAEVRIVRTRMSDHRALVVELVPSAGATRGVAGVDEPSGDAPPLDLDGPDDGGP